MQKAEESRRKVDAVYEKFARILQNEYRMKQAPVQEAPTTPPDS